MEILVYYFILSFCILSLASLGGMFSERTGTINIGINGMMIIGAISYLVFGYYLGQSASKWFQLILIPLSGIFGALFASLHGFASIKLKTDQTISGFAINMLAFGIAIILLYTYGGGSKNISFDVKELALSSDTSYKNILSFRLILTIVIIILAFILVRYTSWGLRLRSIGENPQAADVAGVNVISYKWQGILISGFLSGIAGAFFAQSGPTSFKGEVGGLGYLALAIMIMGQWRIPWITLSVLVFSFLRALSLTLPFIQPDTLGKYSDLLSLIPFILTLIIMIATSKRSAAPAASGISYDKSTR
ncbi:ABC transporter permease [Mycoplasma miroungirhinis]|uniref:ABC transporter permease n=1 Tax=Mycoplasma miroungirhinis TaxID=754516 RepID=A0A6M4JB63_9MOLU|nr:ABC transporter permease [Mycoplasma miroungirhinis]QJR44233.1 ABC transporter permease [Mycoplasma miroungirhinis]